MPKLPDATSLGNRPVAQSQVSVPPGPQNSAGQVRSAIGRVPNSGVGAVTKLVGQVGDAWQDRNRRLQEADLRIQKRSDAIERAKLESEFTLRATEMFAAADKGDRDAGRKFYENLNGLRQEYINQHSQNGLPDSVVDFSETLSSSLDTWTRQFASAELQAQRDFLNQKIAETTNPLVAQIDAGGDFTNAINQFHASMESLSPIDEGRVDAARMAGIEALVETKFNFLLRNGERDAAENFLYTPYAQANISPQTRIRLNGKLENDEKLGTMYQYVDETGRTVYGTAEDVRGRRAPDKKPLVTMTNEAQSAFVQAMGKEEGGLAVEFAQDRLQAINDKVEIARMRGAIESGKFTPGVFSNARHFVAQLAEFMGASDELKAIIGDAATADTLEVATKRLAVDEADKMSRVTNMSLQLISDSLPSLSRTPEGNMILLEVMDRFADRRKQVGALSDEYAALGSFHPPGKPSFWQRVEDLEEDDPILTDDLKEKINSAVAKAPKSFADMFPNTGIPRGFSKAAEPPAGLKLEEGWSYEGEKNGQHWIRSPSGKFYSAPPEALQ